MNEAFLKQMQDLLGDEYDDFLKSLDNEMYKGITINTAKQGDKLIDKYNLKSSGFAKNSYYYNDELSGKSIPYHAGEIYIQEPSASGVIEVADVQTGDYVLDMCAAPGGKSSQIAIKLNNTGLLVSNEYDHKRAQILMSNLERIGVSENIITSGDTELLTKDFPMFFDKVIVDAPCSGEGMIKKHSAASEQWSEAYLETCAKRQLDILDNAYQCCNNDGYIIYSTCTYNTIENEQVIASFLQKYDDLELVDTNVTFGRNGISGYGIDANKVTRVFPMDGGEGHFIAKIHKQGVAQKRICSYAKPYINTDIETFINEQVNLDDYVLSLQNNKVYLRNSNFINTKKVKVLRQGLCVGELKKNRLEVHNHFYKSMLLNDKYQKYIELNEQEALNYLTGNVINRKVEKGYYAVGYNKMVLGFVKSDGAILKNKYPKGLRNI